ncbi:hypothetical protein RUM43_004924 [Polyplax serrata]|uniref:Uncharacterized protein n=1 Tax=Polyplax serrata TaxID=468196 RepID=A0AAN8XM85_POLSC
MAKFCSSVMTQRMRYLPFMPAGVKVDGRDTSQSNFSKERPTALKKLTKLIKRKVERLVPDCVPKIREMYVARLQGSVETYANQVLPGSYQTPAQIRGNMLLIHYLNK